MSMFDCPHCGDTHHVNDFCATGPMSSQPSTPMTHPLTPREKVEQAVKDAIREDAGVGLQMTLTPRFMRGLVDRVLAATSVVDHEAGFVSDKSPALASGSGDHAELAELREHRITADLLISSLKSDKAEAERKLAEAVGLLREMFEDGPVEVAFAGNPIACAELSARCTDFLSKEAERG